MPPIRLALLAVFAVLLGFQDRALAAPAHPADYPLRVHVYQARWQKHPNGEVDGEGRANLFEQGQARAFDYTFTCSELFRASMGWETYPARWRRKDGELEMQIPVAGKPGESRECLLKVVMKKDAAYYKRNGQLNEEPSSVFKSWMEKHNYDPEHGKNQPTGLPAEAEGNSKKD
ncbi:MAG TPA: hypothetical protein VGL00_19590 [Terracidiphilus sp.]|jgi:hypothetical protein